jgi:DNA polymerase elongation subunit (family B)
LERKRLYIDIETCPDIVFSWKTGYKLNITYDNIIRERDIICVGYKWEGENKVHALTWDARQNSKKMIKEIIAVLNEADEIIYHNGDRFDLPWIRTMALVHGLSMPPKYVTIDTLKIARSKFYLNSNRLDYIARLLGIGAKIKTEFDLWKKTTLTNDQACLSKMVKYCKGDVVILEKVHQKLRPHVEAKQNYSALYNSHKQGCPECGSDNLRPNGTRATLTGIIKRQFHCRDCGTYHYKTVK